MRYLIAETSWTMMTLATELAETGTLMTRTDRLEDISHYLRHGEADLLVLAAGDCGPEGVSLARLKGEHPDTPIALVMDRPDAAAIAAALDAGADCIVDAHGGRDEAIMSLQAVARRAHGLGRPQILYGPLRIDLHTRKAYLLSCPLKLSPKIYEMLEFLALRPGQLVTRAALLGHIYGFENEPDPRIFDVYVCTLRACLQASSGAVDIETVRGAGFRFVAADMDPAIAA